MGNCLRVNMTVEAQDVAHVLVRGMEASEQKERNVNGGKNKKVRFNLGQKEGENGDSERGVVRIRVVVTQEELKQLLNYTKDSDHSSVEHLLRRMKKRSKKVCDHGSWRPALESIPEDH